jgi:hypothetical protein
MTENISDQINNYLDELINSLNNIKSPSDNQQNKLIEKFIENLKKTKNREYNINTALNDIDNKLKYINCNINIKLQIKELITKLKNIYENPLTTIENSSKNIKENEELKSYLKDLKEYFEKFYENLDTYPTFGENLKFYFNKSENKGIITKINECIDGTPVSLNLIIKIRDLLSTIQSKHIDIIQPQELIKRIRNISFPEYKIYDNIKNEKKQDDQKQDKINYVNQCTICFDPIDEKNYITHPNNNNDKCKFHKDCILKSLNYSNIVSCPTCKIDMEELIEVNVNERKNHLISTLQDPKLLEENRKKLLEEMEIKNMIDAKNIELQDNCIICEEKLSDKTVCYICNNELHRHIAHCECAHRWKSEGKSKCFMGDNLPLDIRFLNNIPYSNPIYHLIELAKQYKISLNNYLKNEIKVTNIGLTDKYGNISINDFLDKLLEDLDTIKSKIEQASNESDIDLKEIDPTNFYNNQLKIITKFYSSFNKINKLLYMTKDIVEEYKINLNSNYNNIFINLEVNKIGLTDKYGNISLNDFLNKLLEDLYNFYSEFKQAILINKYDNDTFILEYFDKKIFESEELDVFVKKQIQDITTYINMYDINFKKNRLKEINQLEEKIYNLENIIIKNRNLLKNNNIDTIEYSIFDIDEKYIELLNRAMNLPDIKTIDNVLFGYLDTFQYINTFKGELPYIYKQKHTQYGIPKYYLTNSMILNIIKNIIDIIEKEILIIDAKILEYINEKNYVVNTTNTLTDHRRIDLLKDYLSDFIRYINKSYIVKEIKKDEMKNAEIKNQVDQLKKKANSLYNNEILNMKNLDDEMQLKLKILNLSKKFSYLELSMPDNIYEDEKIDDKSKVVNPFLSGGSNLLNVFLYVILIVLIIVLIVFLLVRILLKSKKKLIYYNNLMIDNSRFY